MDALLSLLRRNPFASHEELAAQLNLSAAEVSGRIQAYEADHVILGYAAVVDTEKMAHAAVTAVIEVKITPEREGGFDRLAARIARFDQVQSCYLMSGGYDLLVVVEGRSLREVATFISEKLSTMAGVLATATHFRLKAYKEMGVLLSRPEAPERLAVSP